MPTDERVPNPFQLDGKHWFLAFALVAIVAVLLPELGSQPQVFANPPDYRVPYSVSKDYWLYGRHLDRAANDPAAVFVVGDSVVWGEYVKKDGTLSHFLNTQRGSATGLNYVNAGVNGQFPLALDGLLTHYGRAIRGRKVLLHCNLLWMSSPEADLSSTKEQAFNHQPLVPQLPGSVPCYKADVDTRLGHLVDHAIPVFAFSNHLQIARFDAMSLPDWTLATDGKWPPSYPNIYANPLTLLTAPIPAEPVIDSERGVDSKRHQPWFSRGLKPQSYAWVPLEDSLQWAAFQRIVQRLRAWSCDVIVVLGPFNTHMITNENRTAFDAMSSGVQQWFFENGVGYVAPDTLPQEYYGDASHPLTAGYEQLASILRQNETFIAWSSQISRGVR
ncbi:MAG: hypothetical protein ACI9R3_001250 [Verrucomicrobiales bacterium]|jgi:hypothetical protein